MDDRRRRMPAEAAIRRHWSATDLPARKGFALPSGFLSPGVCFACGTNWHGGADAPDNLHMLCHACYKDSEVLEGPAYWAWSWERTFEDTILSRAARVTRPGVTKPTDVGQG